jgi:hypothetical protein
MDRRRLMVTGAAACALTGPVIQIGGLVAAFADDQRYPHDVWDLDPGSDVPTSYSGFMTAGEKQNILKGCATGKQKCFPLPAEDLPKPKARYFKSYSLFLISNPAWLGPNSDGRIVGLHQAYQAFSRAIGSDHAAVFFWKKRPGLSTESLPAPTSLRKSMRTDAQNMRKRSISIYRQAPTFWSPDPCPTQSSRWTNTSCSSSTA